MQVFCDQDSCNVVGLYTSLLTLTNLQKFCTRVRNQLPPFQRAGLPVIAMRMQHFFAQGNRRLAHTEWYITGRISHVATSRHNSVVLNKYASVICMFSWLFKLTNSMSGTSKKRIQSWRTQLELLAAAEPAQPARQCQR